jgi:menaquinone-dependent protoporphyrinogen oxidase
VNALAIAVQVNARYKLLHFFTHLKSIPDSFALYSASSKIGNKSKKLSNNTRKRRVAMKNRNRREFIVDSAKMTAAAIFAAAAANELLLPLESEASGIKLPESSCGVENKNGPKVLIAYASQCGSTGEVAEAIGDVLCQCGDFAETKWVKSVKALNGYSAVIIGSAIHKSRWMPEATDFVTTNQNTLSKLPVAYFFTCLTLSVDTDKARRKAMTFLEPLQTEAPRVKPVSVGRFAGVLDYSKLSFMYRTVMKRKMKERGIQEGDYRDWNAIRSWAAEVHVKLLDEQT